MLMRGVGGRPNVSVKKSYSLVADWASCVGRVLVGDGDVDLDVTSADGDWRHESGQQ